MREIRASHVIADKGYDTEGILDFVQGQGATAVIPPRSNRRVPREYDREAYKQRCPELDEGWRRIATRYDRRSACFLAALHLAAAVTWSA